MIDWVRNLPAGCWPSGSGGTTLQLPYKWISAEMTALKGFV